MVMHFTSAKITVVADSCFCSEIVDRPPVETLMLLSIAVWMLHKLLPAHLDLQTPVARLNWTEEDIDLVDQIALVNSLIH